MKQLDVFNRSSGCILPISIHQVSRKYLRFSSHQTISQLKALASVFQQLLKSHSYDGSNIKNSSRMGHSNSETPKRLANFVSVTRNHPSCKGQSVTFRPDTRDSCQSPQVSSRTNMLATYLGIQIDTSILRGFPTEVRCLKFRA